MKHKPFFSYLNFHGNHPDGCDAHFLGLMLHNECAWTGDWFPWITVVVINVDSKVVNCWINLFHQGIGTIALVAIVEAIKCLVMWISPASAVALGKKNHFTIVWQQHIEEYKVKLSNMKIKQNEWLLHLE